MAEAYIVVLLWIAAIGLFVVYNKFHKYLNKTWENNAQYSIYGNDGKELSLLRVNGIGLSFYGKYRELLIGDNRTYVTYYVFCLFFIPILPLGCFRVIKENGGYNQKHLATLRKYNFFKDLVNSDLYREILHSSIASSLKQMMSKDS